jgi:MFS family permease
MSRWLPATSGLPPTYWYLWMGTLVNRIGALVVPFLTIYLTEVRGLSITEAGAIAALYGLGTFAAGPTGGFLADRIGRKRTMLVGLGLGAMMMLSFGAARSFAQLGVAASLLGLGGDMYRPAVMAAVTDLVPPADRPRAFGLLYWAVNLGFAVAPMLAGPLADYSFTSLIVGDALTTAAFAVVIWLRVPETAKARAAEAPRPLAFYLAPYRDPLLLGFVAAFFVVAVVFHQGMLALPLDMRSDGLSAVTYGRLISLNGGLIVLLQPFALNVVQRAPRAPMMVLGIMLTGLGFGVTGLASSTAMYALSIVLWTLGEIVMSPVTPTIIADLAPDDLRGSYQGAHHMAWGAAMFAAPVAGSFVLTGYGSGVLWAGCFVACAVAALAQVALAGPMRRRRRRGDEGPSELGTSAA